MSIYVILGLLVLAWFLFSGWRTIEEDFEARLAPLTPTGPAANARGKAERERFKDGGEEFDLSCSGFDLPDGTPVDVLLNGEVMGSFELQQGRGRFKLDAASGVAVPAVSASDTVELHCGGLPVLRGTFAVD